MREKIKKAIAVSGMPGSFSEEAGILYAERESYDPEFVFAIDMEGVLKALEEGTAEIGVFPVVNSRGGLVRSAFEAMGKYTFTIINEIWFEVYQCLMIKKGTAREEITQITTHPQAIAQCERYLRKNFEQAKLVEWEDTAKAAKDLSEGKLSSNTAVIAPARSAHIYDLEIIEKGIQDNHPNLTTFIVVTK